MVRYLTLLLHDKAPITKELAYINESLYNMVKTIIIYKKHFFTVF